MRLERWGLSRVYVVCVIRSLDYQPVVDTTKAFFCDVE